MGIIRKKYVVKHNLITEVYLMTVMETTTCFGLYWPSSGCLGNLRASYMHTRARFMGIITALTTARNLSLLWARLIQPSYYHPIPSRSTSIPGRTNSAFFSPKHPHVLLAPPIILLNWSRRSFHAVNRWRHEVNLLEQNLGVDQGFFWTYRLHGVYRDFIFYFPF